MRRAPNQTTVDPFFLSLPRTRVVLGDAGESLVRKLIEMGFLTRRYCGRKLIFEYTEVKTVAKLIAAGEFAPACKPFRNHQAAIENSIASRRRKAQARISSRGDGAPVDRRDARVP
jgi:hypothetical protein